LAVRRVSGAKRNEWWEEMFMKVESVLGDEPAGRLKVKPATVRK